MQKPNIYVHSRFAPMEFSNGGDKRTAQIHELLSKSNIAFQKAELERYMPRSKSLALYLKGITYGKKISFSRRYHHIGRYLKTFSSFISIHKPSLFIWESVSEQYLLLARKLWDQNVPLIALPHNIESLVKGNRSFFSHLVAPKWFSEEIGYLKYANVVFTISREEQWLLSLYGVKADYLPYYPVESVQQFLMNIRAKRKGKHHGSKIKKVLLLGTFYNPPTITGYIELLKQLIEIKDIEINIAGYGSEKMAKLSDKNVKIWGTISNETLSDILIDINVAIIHQEPTTGALTRIPELLIAGVPVIANSSAARNYYDLDGVYTYYNFNELFSLIATTTITLPPIPQRPADAEKRFIDTVRTLTWNGDCLQKDH